MDALGAPSLRLLSLYKKPTRLLRIGFLRQRLRDSFLFIETAKLLRYCIVNFHHEDLEFPQGLVQKNIYRGIYFFQGKHGRFSA